MQTLTQFELLDLFFRFASVGSLVFISLFMLDKSAAVPLWITRCLLICLSGYLILTAPIDNAIYGYFRGLVLFLTELLPYFLWLYVFTLIKPERRIQDIHWLMKASVFCLFLWMVYFFGILHGSGSFHQINHVLGIVLYCHIAFMAMYNFKDDLVPQRRKTRAVMAVFFGAYSSVLAFLEIFDSSLRAEPLFSVINSLTIFLMIFLFTILVTKSSGSDGPVSDDLAKLKYQGKVAQAIPLIFKADLDKIRMLMQQQFYTQSNLTIGVLAKELAMPEHRLRLLINKHLGFQNFSAFLNSYRIPAAQQILKNPQHARLAVLTIALELGFGSIGPFNRTFKQVTGTTPSEYRKNFQNQP